MAHPDHILRPGSDETLPDFEPVYPLTQGLTPRHGPRRRGRPSPASPELPEWIEPSVKRQRRWPDWRARAARRPRPRRPGRPRARRSARERLAYDELLAHQVTLALARARR